MARKEKTSFFGKIMGGSVTDDEPETTYFEEEVVTEPADSSGVDADEELTAEDDTDETMMPPMASDEDETEEDTEAQAPARPQPAAGGNEEWLNDFEGQLNIDMYQTKDNVIIKSTIAGVRPEDIDITVANDMLTIKGSRRKEDTIAQDDYFYQECYWGNFSRSVIIPVDIDSEEIEADLKDGILTIVIAKAAKAKTKKVKVKGL